MAHLLGRAELLRGTLVAYIAGAIAGAVACVALAGCGSQLSPDEASRATSAASSAASGATESTDTAMDAVSGAPSSHNSPGSAVVGAPSGRPGGSGAQATGSLGAVASPGSGAGGHHTAVPGSGSDPNGGNAASCDGFDNAQPGVTPDSITIANVSDVSGPVPGVFESARLATQAFAAYFNSTSDICGHKLVVQALDSRTEAGADQQAYATACDHAFAAVGSMSAFDYGGAGTASACGLPDLRSTSVSTTANQCDTCFSAQAVAPNLVPSSLPKFFADTYGDAVKHAAVLYMDAEAGAVNARSFKVAFERNGWHVDVFSGIDVSAFNYAPYVQEMKNAGSEAVVFLGASPETVRLQQAMAEQDFKPAVFAQDSTIYNSAYVDQAGALGNGTFSWTSTNLLDSDNREMTLYREWLQQVSPGAVPDSYGVYAWSAARLFTREAQALGGGLTRAALVKALTGVHDWTDDGLHGPEQVGRKQTDKCVSVVRLADGDWTKVSPGSYVCGPLTDTGVTG